jgi:aldehyde:ferredoxin oxidoreductase
MYVGGLGLGARIIYDEVPLDVTALDPENRLVFTTGPITGTTVPGSSDWTVTSLRHELDSKVIQGSHSHGYWGAFLKMNGIDGLIVQGAAQKPFYLWVHDGRAELRDASQFWGLDTHETEDAVKADLEAPADQTSVATIGPAGENLVNSASIENDKMHSASKGMGCIMGAKKLKAIAVTRGPYSVPIAKPVEFMKVALTLREATGVARGSRVLANAVRGEPDASGPYFTTGKNYSDPEWSRQFRAAWKRGADDFPVDPKGCWGCSTPCAYRIQVTTGPHAGYEATLAGGWENSEGAAAMAGVDEPGTAIYLTDLVDRLGLDAGSVACSIGLAIECYEKGILTKEKTGGLELRWGDAELTEKLWRMAANREKGFGELLADGPKATAEYIGGEALNMVVHVKGAAPNLHDWRARPSIIVGQMTSPGGPCWQGSLGVEFGAEPDLGILSPMDAWDQEGKGKAVAKTEMRATFEDCNGVCWFGGNAPRRSEGYHTWLAQSIGAATGWEEFTPQEVLEVGERVMNLQRVYAIRRGMTKADDLDVGPRFIEPHKVGLTKGLDIGPHLRGMVEDFYETMGWDRETGTPLPETLRRLGLEELIPDLHTNEQACSNTR